MEGAHQRLASHWNQRFRSSAVAASPSSSVGNSQLLMQDQSSQKLVVIWLS